MAKIATDIEQSKQLAEILPIESADMIYSAINNSYPWVWEDKPLLHKNDTPAWSLTALLNILKYPELVQTYDEKWSIADWTGQHPKCLYGKDTPVDACVEMIKLLKERDLL